ncbi:hypothetical protein AMTRI_Chr06g171930 [Amborella trichopoda]
MQLTPNLTFSLIFFPKTNLLCKYPLREKVHFFRRKYSSRTQKSFCSTLPEHAITLSERTSVGPPSNNNWTETE